VLRFSSCQAEIAESFCRALSAFIGERLGVSTEFIGEVPWQERERLLDCGQIDVCWICGLSYVRKRNSGESHIDLLGAPVMKNPRYAGKPVYYSDVIVRAESSFRTFDDLCGAAWAYNEPGSHSGYNLIRYHLVAAGKRNGYFGRVVESGSHQESLRMILAGSIDASAIDSTVLELDVARNPSIIEKIRTIAVLGPSPAPPWVCSSLSSAGCSAGSTPEVFRDAFGPAGRTNTERRRNLAVRARLGRRLRSYSRNGPHCRNCGVVTDVTASHPVSYRFR